MSVKAKFYVQSVKKFSHGFHEVELMPVQFSPEKNENQDWAEATPTGKIEMSITNEAAVDQFKVGAEYYVTFDPA